MLQRIGPVSADNKHGGWSTRALRIFSKSERRATVWRATIPGAEPWRETPQLVGTEASWFVNPSWPTPCWQQQYYPTTGQCHPNHSTNKKTNKKTLGDTMWFKVYKGYKRLYPCKECVFSVTDTQQTRSWPSTSSVTMRSKKSDTKVTEKKSDVSWPVCSAEVQTEMLSCIKYSKIHFHKVTW